MPVVMVEEFEGHMVSVHVAMVATAACRKGLLLVGLYIRIFLRVGHGGYVRALLVSLVVVEEEFEGQVVPAMMAMVAYRKGLLLVGLCARTLLRRWHNRHLRALVALQLVMEEEFEGQVVSAVVAAAAY